jgi:hypothetical protein
MLVLSAATPNSYLFQGQTYLLRLDDQPLY